MPNDLPSLLVVEQGTSLSPLLGARFRVATCPVESVALEYVAESRPTAVLLHADALYLEGPAHVDRWRAACPGTRVVFVDTEGPYCLLMEVSEAEVAINPCAIDEIASAVGELLGSGGKEVQDDRMAVVAV